MEVLVSTQTRLKRGKELRGRKAGGSTRDSVRPAHILGMNCSWEVRRARGRKEVVGLDSRVLSSSLAIFPGSVFALSLYSQHDPLRHRFGTVR